MPHAISKEGLALLKRLEGFRAEALQLPDGRWLVGYGHVAAMAPMGPIDEAEAERLLRTDLAPVEAALNDTVLAPVSQAQFDALASFTFSIGTEAFARSDVLRRVNAGEPIAAACAMDAWRKSAIAGEPTVLDALVRRRAAEKAHFLDLARAVPAASALVRPQIDHAVAILGSPTKTAELPTAAPRVALDETAQRLAGILAREPATEHALRPPPARLDLEDEEPVLELTRPVGTAVTSRDISSLAIFGLGGAGLFAAGLLALTQGRETMFLLLTAPGAVMLISAAWRLLKDTALARWRFGPLRG
jgi:lysozyme